jgi:hypothetical protein
LQSFVSLFGTFVRWRSFSELQAFLWGATVFNRSVVLSLSLLTTFTSLFFEIVEHVRALEFLAEVKSSATFAAVGTWLATPTGAALVSAIVVGLLMAVIHLWRTSHSSGRVAAPPEEIVEEERFEGIHTKRTIRKVSKS